MVIFPSKKTRTWIFHSHKHDSKTVTRPRKPRYKTRGTVNISSSTLSYYRRGKTDTNTTQEKLFSHQHTSKNTSYLPTSKSNLGWQKTPCSKSDYLHIHYQYMEDKNSIRCFSKWFLSDFFTLHIWWCGCRKDSIFPRYFIRVSK